MGGTPGGIAAAIAAAHLAIQDEVAIRQVPVQKLQTLLMSHGQVIRHRQ